MITWMPSCQEGQKIRERLRKCISSGESPVFTDVSRFMSKDLRHAYGCKGSPMGRIGPQAPTGGQWMHMATFPALTFSSGTLPSHQITVGNNI